MTDGNSNSSTGVGLAPGGRIGKYEVCEKLGAGGQAIVYKCHDPLLDRFVAIKQISSHLADDPRFMERFRREAQILAKRGGDVIAVHELLEDERGLFIVMEFVEGHSLETILRDTDGPVEVKASLQILWRLAASLNEIHAAGVIHRDLKPSNIIISEGLRPRIADFGVAAGASGQTSMVLGTTKYMAPEMFEGAPVGGRADIYSLGFVLYEMLVGRPHFREVFADIVRDPHSEAMRWMKWHGNRKVTAPLPHEINPEVPEALSRIVARMIAKDLSERFTNMEELGRAIKSTFSPKARAATGAAAPASKRRRAGHVGEGKPPVIEPDEGTSPAPEPISKDSAPTAELPKAKMALRTKLILCGVAAVGFVALVTVLAVQSYQATQARAEAARKLYTDSKTLYDDARKADAVDRLQAIHHRAVNQFKESRYAAARGELDNLHAVAQTQLEGLHATALSTMKTRHQAKIKGLKDPAKRQELAKAQAKELADLTAGQAKGVEGLDKRHAAAVELFNRRSHLEAEKAVGEIQALAATWARQKGANDFAEAADGFARAAKKYKDAPEAAKASVMAHFARVRYLVLKATLAQRRGDHDAAKELWLDADGEINKARERVARVVAKWDGKVEQWARKKQADIDPMKDERDSAQQFVERFVRARELFDAGKLDEASKELAYLETETDRSYREPQAKTDEREALKRSIVAAQFKKDLAAEIARGDALADSGDLSGAVDVYKQVLQHLGDTGAEFLSKLDRDTYAADLNARVGSGKNRQEYLKAKAEADNARKRGDKGAELGALRRMQGISESQVVKDRITKLDSDELVKKGRRALPNRRRAKRFFEKAWALNRNPEARAELDKLDRADKRSRLIAEGDVALSGQQFAQALARYNEAAKLGVDDSLSEKIVDCRFRQADHEGDLLAKARKYDQAAEAYKRAAGIKPAEQATMNAKIAAVDGRKHYEGFLAAGDAAAKKKNYRTAKKQYALAKTRAAGPRQEDEVALRIKTVHYGENVELGREAMGQRDYKSAVAHFRMALGYLDTPEIHELIKEAKRLAGQGEG